MKQFRTKIDNTFQRYAEKDTIVMPHSPYGILTGLFAAYWQLTIVPIDVSLPLEEICCLRKCAAARGNL